MQRRRPNHNRLLPTCPAAHGLPPCLPTSISYVRSKFHVRRRTIASAPACLTLAGGFDQRGADRPGVRRAAAAGRRARPSGAGLRPGWSACSRGGHRRWRVPRRGRCRGSRQLLQRSPVDLDGELLRMHVRPRRLGVLRLVEPVLYVKAQLVHCEVVEAQQPVGLVEAETRGRGSVAGASASGVPANGPKRRCSRRGSAPIAGRASATLPTARGRSRPPVPRRTGCSCPALPHRLARRLGAAVALCCTDQPRGCPQRTQQLVHRSCGARMVSRFGGRRLQVDRHPVCQFDGLGHLGLLGAGEQLQVQVAAERGTCHAAIRQSRASRPSCAGCR